MIVFLTLCYVAVLAVLVKIRVVPLNTFWKLSPLLWMLALFVALFMPMQWGAPAGAVNVYRDVVEIIPNVSGEVVDVRATALTPMKKGDVLFTIDPRPYQAEVDRLRASLATALSIVGVKAAMPHDRVTDDVDQGAPVLLGEGQARQDDVFQFWSGQGGQRRSLRPSIDEVIPEFGRMDAGPYTAGVM